MTEHLTGHPTGHLSDALPPRVDEAWLKLLLDQVPSSTGESRSATAPFTGRPLPAVPQTGPADVAAAAARARAAQQAWAARPVAARAEVVRRIGELVLRERERVLDLVQWETGKSRVHAGIELLGVPAVAAYYAAQGTRQLAPTTVRSAIPGVVRARVLRHPKGLVGVIAPWNYPLFLAVGDVLPALVAGNGVLSKADSQAPLTLLAVRALAAEAGLPDDLWAVLAGPGSQLGKALLDEIDHLAFTGSTATGRRLAAAAGERLVSTSLELGGKNPMIVRADADLGAAVAGAVQACFASAGQMCIGIERIYVHAAVHDEFCRRLADAVGRLSVGASYDLGCEIGSLTSAEQLAATRRHVEDAVAKGARVLAGGRARPDLGPFFHEPTVLTGVTPEMAVHAEETFGPVVSVHPVADDEEAVLRANDSEYGLSASIWSRDLDTARALAERLQAGAVNVNDGYLSAISSLAAPMGGMKASGVGRRHGPEGILRYTEAQTTTTQRVATPYPRRAGGYLAATRLLLQAQLKTAGRTVRRQSRKES